jgi:tetratricopeptide (TPR) repeat protein
MRTTASGLIRLLPAALPATAHAAAAGGDLVEAASQAVSLTVWVVVLIILIPVAILVLRKVLHQLHETREQAVAPPPPDAQKLEAKGDYLGAAVVSEQKGELLKAAGLYERARDYAKAAELHETLGNLDRAIQLHYKSGGSLKAAEINVKLGNYLEAAKIFRNKGDHFRAAQALEKNGNRVAAAREYLVAGQTVRAAKLYKDEGLYPEAAEAYRSFIGKEKLSHTTITHYYTLAAFLVLAREYDKAASIYGGILALDPGHQKAREKLHSLITTPESVPEVHVLNGSAAAAPGPAGEGDAMAPPADAAAVESSATAAIEESYTVAETVDPLAVTPTLRSLISGSRMEPKYSMRLWIQILRSLAERHRSGTFFGAISPEQILVDMQNNVEILERQGVGGPYTAPEVLAGAPPDAQADVYAMGVILYEMVAGDLENLGTRSPIQVQSDVPGWLDALIMHCLETDPARRYRDLDQISAELVKLKNSM